MGLMGRPVVTLEAVLMQLFSFKSPDNRQPVAIPDIAQTERPYPAHHDYSDAFHCSRNTRPLSRARLR